MSQNDPLLGTEWSEREEPVNGLPIGLPLNGINHSNKTHLNDPSIGFDSNSHSKHNSNHFTTNSNNDNNANRKGLMSAIGLSSSDTSSSEDIVIPMQRRKLKTRYSRKRRSRSSDSNMSLKGRTLTNCPTVCVRLALTLLAICSIGFTALVMAKLYDRIDSLQTVINDLSMSGNTVPQEMHTIHSHLKALDTNVTAFKADLLRAFEHIDNLTQEVIQIKAQMSKISDSVEAAPAIRQLPKELQDLQKVVAEMGSRLSTNDNEVKSIKDKQTAQQSGADAIQTALTAISANITDLYALAERNVTSNQIQSKVDQNSNHLSELSDSMTKLETLFTDLINWRTSADERIRTVMSLAQHIHEKLHNQTLEEHPFQGEHVITKSQNEPNVSESTVQSFAENQTQFS